MEEQDQTELSKWPYFLAYITLLAVAVTIVLIAPKPYSIEAMTGAIICALVGPFFLLAPFLIEYFSRLKLERNQLREASEEQFANSLRLVGELEALQKVFTRQAEQGAAHVLGLEGLVPQLEKHSKHLDRLAKEFMQTAKSEKKAQTQESLDALAKDLAGVLKQFKKIPSALEKQITELKEFETPPQPDLEQLGKLLEKHSSRSAPQDDSRIESAAKEISPSSPQPDFEFDEKLELEAEIDSSLAEDEDGEGLEPSRTTLDDAGSISLIVNLLGGIGNTPYIRGEGVGLSWDQGVEMRFVEIGKWEWSASDVEEPVRVRIYLNDKISAYGEDIELKAGEQLEITPEFQDS